MKYATINWMMDIIVNLNWWSKMNTRANTEKKKCWLVFKGKLKKALQERDVRPSPKISKQERRFNEKGMKNEVNDTKKGIPKGQIFNNDNT